MEAGAHDHVVKDPFVGIGGNVNDAAPGVDLRDRVSQNYLAARLDDIGGKLFGNDAEVDDRGSRDQQRRESPNMWLAVAQLCCIDQTRSGDPVACCPVGELEQVREFVIPKSNDHFADLFVRKSPFGTIGAEELAPRRHNVALSDPGG